jgi:tRNA G46 methylase TrmB
MTQSQKYTLKDVQKEEADWKDLILQNEVTLLGHFSVLGLHYAYDEAEHNAWIVKTLVDKKQRYKFKNCNSIVLVGCGLYPYSMFDLHKQYPHIKQVGLEIDSKRAIVARKLIKESPAKNAIKIITTDGLDFDYSWMTQEDFVFISVDVDGENIFSKILKTSKAQPLVCAPYKYTWLKNLATVIY